MEEKELLTITEGSAKVYIHKEDQDSIPSKSMGVFYNKKMEINRDMTNLAILAYDNLYPQEGLKIIDSMAASGVSSIRLLNVCDNIKKLYINDINPIAVNLIKKNLKLNEISESDVRIKISRKDANFLFSEINQNHYFSSDVSERPNIISIDPFGTPNIYVDGALKVIQKDKGLLCITATDTAVLFGVRLKACIRKYMSKPLHNDYCKEIGARILIHFISRLANINNLGIIPLLTFNSNHFVRIFALTFKNKEDISKTFEKYGYIIHCKECHNSTPSIGYNYTKCLMCGSLNDVQDHAGPLWLGELHDENFIREILKVNEAREYQNKKKINKLLMLALEEINMLPYYFNIHKLTKELKIPNVPKMERILNLLKENGFQASRTHFEPLGIKTNALYKDLHKILEKLI